MLSPHGHWTYGRLENTAINSGPGRAIGLARQGFVVFTHDMVGYGDSRQVPHTFGGRRENLWGLSLGGLQLWNGIRALDFLETLPYVRRDGFGVTGESGGGTQTFLLGAVDPRVAVAVPVNMISLHMQGGCLCENMPGLRVDTNNVEIAATIAPRPLLMVSATGDWTEETLESRVPGDAQPLCAARRRAEGARRPLHRGAQLQQGQPRGDVRVDGALAQQAPEDVKRPERSFTADKITDLLVFYSRSLPDGAVTPGAAHRSVDRLGEGAARGADPADPRDRAAPRAWLRRRAAARPRPRRRRPRRQRGGRPSWRAHSPSVDALLRKAGFDVRAVTFTPFDAAAAGEGPALRDLQPDRGEPARGGYRRRAARIAVGGARRATATRRCRRCWPPRSCRSGKRSSNVGGFDTSSDAQFLERVYIPGLRRAGDFQTAAGMARGE